MTYIFNKFSNCVSHKVSIKLFELAETGMLRFWSKMDIPNEL